MIFSGFCKFHHFYILLQYNLEREQYRFDQTNKTLHFQTQYCFFSTLKHLKASDTMPKKSDAFFAYLIWMLETVPFEIRNCHLEYKWHNLPIFLWAKMLYRHIEAEGLLYTNFRAHIYARNNFPLQRFGHAISLTRMCMTLRNMLLIFKSEINFSV